MKLFLTLTILACLWLLSGCAQMFTAKTTVRYEKRPDGTVIAEYSSDKEQVGLEATLGDASIRVDKAGTPIEAINAAVRLNERLFDAIQQGASKGVNRATIP